MRQWMRVAEFCEETAKEMQERGGAEVGERVNVNWWRERHGKGGRPRAAALWAHRGRGSRQDCFLDKEFEVPVAMWMGLPVVRRACPTPQCGQQLEIWGVHGGMTCGGASGATLSEARWLRHNELP